MFRIQVPYLIMLNPHSYPVCCWIRVQSGSGSRPLFVMNGAIKDFRILFLRSTLSQLPVPWWAEYQPRPFLGRAGHTWGPCQGSNIVFSSVVDPDRNELVRIRILLFRPFRILTFKPGKLNKSQILSAHSGTDTELLKHFLVNFYGNTGSPHVLEDEMYNLKKKFAKFFQFFLSKRSDPDPVQLFRILIWPGQKVPDPTLVRIWKTGFFTDWP